MKPIDYSDSWLSDNTNAIDPMLNNTRPEFLKLEPVLQEFYKYMQLVTTPIIDKESFALFGAGQDIGVPEELTEFFRDFLPLTSDNFTVLDVANYFGLSTRDIYVRFMDIFLNYSKYENAIQSDETIICQIQDITETLIESIERIYLPYSAYHDYAFSRFDNLVIPQPLFGNLTGTLKSYIGSNWSDYFESHHAFRKFVWGIIKQNNVIVEAGTSRSPLLILATEV